MRDQVHQLQHRAIKSTFKFLLETVPYQEAIPSTHNTFYEPICFSYDCNLLNSCYFNVIVLMTSRSSLEITTVMLDSSACFKLCL